MYDYEYIPDISYEKHLGKYGFLDLYIPKNKPNCSAIIYFHGGGIENGDRTCDRALYEYLALHGIAVITADYRLYPEAAFPQFIEDAAKAAVWARRNADRYGFNKIYIGGSSAGSYLSMMLFFDKTYLAAHGLVSSDFAGFFFDAGQPTVHYNILRERGEDTRLVRLDEAAPIFHITHDYDADSPLPKIKILAADNDIPCRLEQNLLLKSTMIAFGYPSEKISFQLMKGYGHCEYVGAFEDGKSILGDIIIAFMKP